MSWRDRFKEGSFRGAPFLIQESQAEFGRRNKVHEYPQRDLPWVEDLGRSARRWSLSCYVVGDDYDQARDALIAALEAKGPGTLIHPYLGTVTASLERPAQVSDSTAEGGMARFQLQFVENAGNTVPAAAADTQAVSIASAANLQAVAATNLGAQLVVQGAPTFVASAGQSLLGQAQGAINQALSLVQAPAALLGDAQQQIQALTTNGLALLQAPQTLAAQIFSAVGEVADLAPYAEDALNALCGPFLSGPIAGSGLGAPSPWPAPPQPLGGLLNFGATIPAVATPTPSRIIQAANQAVLIQTVQCAAAAAAVTVVTDMTFTSYDDAAGIRDALAEQLDTLATAIADSGNAALADAVDDLRLSMSADVTARGASLARLYAYTPTQTEPAVVIAQRLYGDATMAEDILARNAVANPGFLSAGVALEVISNA